jgi:hypothetical protein
MGSLGSKKKTPSPHCSRTKNHRANDLSLGTPGRGEHWKDRSDQPSGGMSREAQRVWDRRLRVKYKMLLLLNGTTGKSCSTGQAGNLPPPKVYVNPL